MNKRMKNAIAALNQIAANELGGSVVPRKRRKRRPSAFADIKKYRREHPDADMSEAYAACRGNLSVGPQPGNTHENQAVGTVCAQNPLCLSLPKGKGL